MRVTGLLFVALLSHCGMGFAQSSTDFISANIAESYLILKTVMMTEIDNTMFEHTDGESDEYVTIGSCNNSDTYFLVHGPKRRALVDIAWKMISAERILTRRNFPIDKVKVLLRKREMELLSRVEQGDLNIGDDDEFEFVDNLNKEFAQDAALPRIGPVECGGGPLELIANVQPRGAKVYIVPKIFYIFCEKTGINPIDRERCDHWFPPIRDGERIEVGGIYKVVFEIGGVNSSVEEFDFDRYWGKDVVLLKRQ